MILLDAQALIAHSANEPAAPEVEEILRSGAAAMNSVNLFEVIEHLLRRTGLPESGVRFALGQLIDDALEVRDVTQQEAWRGASLRARYYRKCERPLSLAYCVLLATAREGRACDALPRP